MKYPIYFAISLLLLTHIVPQRVHCKAAAQQSVYKDVAQVGSDYGVLSDSEIEMLMHAGKASSDDITPLCDRALDAIAAFDPDKARELGQRIRKRSREPRPGDPAAADQQIVEIGALLNVDEIINTHSGTIEIDATIDLGSNNLETTGTISGAALSSANNIASAGSVVLNYDNDGSISTGDDDGVEFRENGTPLLRVDKDGIEISNRDLDLGGNNITGAATVNTSSVTASSNVDANEGAVETTTITNSGGDLTFSGGVVSNIQNIRLPSIPNREGTVAVNAGSAIFGGNKSSTTPSSRRYKRNIASLSQSDIVLLDVSPKTFAFRGNYDDEYTHHGVIAQELAQIAPDLVRYDADGEPMTVEYYQMIPILVKIWQDQQKEIAELRSILHR